MPKGRSKPHSSTRASSTCWIGSCAHVNHANYQGLVAPVDEDGYEESREVAPPPLEGEEAQLARAPEAPRKPPHDEAQRRELTRWP